MRLTWLLALWGACASVDAPREAHEPGPTARTTTDTFDTFFGLDSATIEDTYEAGPDIVEGATQLVFVIDITGSWGERGFANVRLALRDALLGILDRQPRALQVGMVVFTNRFAWEYTPLTRVDASTGPALGESWSRLNIASKAGVDADPRDGIACALHGGPRANDFSDPAGGCYPNMPREYRDEPGTDHAVGLSMVSSMFALAPHRAENRRVILITDGQPNQIGASSGQTRLAQGYIETRWRQWVGPAPRTADDIRLAASSEADLLYEQHGADINAISAVVDDPILAGMARGEGEAAVASSQDQLRLLVVAALAEAAGR
jgi:hypothetical protein